ncbi:hypothetical protein IJG72_05235 [bacterium]|nr:hypothetical protein [bacterium]
MFYKYFQFDDYNFDDCMGKGICSVDPTITALQEVITMYLKELAFYTLRLKKKGVTNKIIRDNIINTISGLSSNTDYSHEQFEKIVMNLYENIRQSKILYERLCKGNNENSKNIEKKLDLNKNFNFNEAIKQGEKEFIRKNKLLSKTQRQIYDILLILIKNVCMNLIQLKSYNKECDNSYYTMLHVLNVIDYKKFPAEKLKKFVNTLVKTNYSLQKILHDAEKERYGKQEPIEVSFSTRPNKAILVSGSNLKELEEVLNATKGQNIDVYTHGSMILGHTYPKIKEYKHLIGQYGLGVENCLLDFATFPGSILMTKNSLQNVEYLYRGRLFTTDINVPKGITQIFNNDYRPLIESAQKAKGFAKGQIREPLKIGYQENVIKEKVNEVIKKIKAKNIKHLFIIGILNHTSLQKNYFSRLLKSIPKTTYAITLSTYIPTSNTFQINSSYDFMLMYEILEDLNRKTEEKTFDISVFLTKCDKFAIANLLNLKLLNVDNIFLGHCSPMLINPRITDAFRDIFEIKMITTPKEDLDSLKKIS